MTVMAYQALVFCTDAKVTQVLSAVLGELDFRVDSSHEPYDAVKKLTERHFDALLVDCVDEQNAALLFKSARNSEMNSASLAVAVVENQAAISKAFRIGANLILTKPINVEQIKGTLRVARGLLKKTDQAKQKQSAVAPQTVAATPLEIPQSSAAAHFAEDPEPVANLAFTRPEPEPSSSPFAFSTPVLELDAEEETAPPLGPAEAALLEAMPEMVPEQPVAGLPDKHAAWKSVFTPENESAASIPESAAPAQAESHATQPAPSLGSFSFGAAAAAAPAPAPAKEAEPLELPPIEAETPAPPAAKPAAKTTKGSKKSSRAGTKAKSEDGDKFSWQDAAREQDESEQQHSGKNLLVAAVLVLALAAAGYFAWPRIGPAVMSLPFVQKYIVPHLGLVEGSTPRPAQPAPSPVQSGVSANAAQPAASATPSDGNPQAQPGSEGSTTVVVPSGTKPDAGTPLAANPAATPQEIITVKSGSTDAISKPGSTKVPAPPALNSSAGSDQTVAGLVTAAPAVPKPMQGLHVPEATMEGLLTRKVQPIYPTLAAQMRVEGTVQLEARIGKDGSVASLKLLHGDPMLAQAATDAVHQWKYKPYVLGGQVLEVQTEITVIFKLP